MSAYPKPIIRAASSSGTLTRAPVDASGPLDDPATGALVDSNATPLDSGADEDDSGATEEDSGAELDAGAEEDSGADELAEVQVAVGKNRPLAMLPACTSTCTKHRPSADSISGKVTVLPKSGPIWKSLFHWWSAFEPACGEASRFW